MHNRGSGTTTALLDAGVLTLAGVELVATASELLALTGVDEPVGAWYLRKDLVRSAAAEDDANNR